MSEDNGNPTAVVPVPTGLSDDHLLAVAAQAERRIEAVNKIKQLALKVTNARDWRDQGGNPYLQVSGAEKVARLFGISWRIDEPIREEHADGHFSYTVKGYFSMGTAEIEVVGTRSSTDPFFCKQHGAVLPPAEIDRNDVKKGAVTNCLGNGITRLLGIRNLRWEDLKESGINQDDIGKVEYRSGDPNEAARLPNYGRNHCKGKPVNDPAVTVEDLQYYLQGVERSLADPEKAKYKANNLKLKAALEAELTERAKAKQAKPASVEETPTESSTEEPDPFLDLADDEAWRQMVAQMQNDHALAFAATKNKFRTDHPEQMVKFSDRKAFVLTWKDEVARLKRKA